MPPPEPPAGAPCRLVVVRHGRTAWNAARRIQGWTDVPLDALGAWQAARVAEALAGAEPGRVAEPLDAVYASDLQRALQTAAPLLERLARQGTPLPLHAQAALRERCFGVFEGLTADEVLRDHASAAARWRAREPGFAPPDGESLRDFAARALGALRGVAARHPGGRVAVFTHGGVLDALYRAATGTPLEAPRHWTMDNAALCRVLGDGAGTLSIAGWGDTAHLDAPPQDGPPQDGQAPD